MGSESFSLAEWKSVHIISADNSKSSFWSDVLRIVHICPYCQLSAIKLRISTMGMLMGWVFLPIGDRDELVLFLGPGWNVFLCWTTKNSQQWFHISIWWQRWQWIFSWPYDKDLFGFDERLWRQKVADTCFEPNVLSGWVASWPYHSLLPWHELCLWGNLQHFQVFFTFSTCLWF